MCSFHKSSGNIDCTDYIINNQLLIEILIVVIMFPVQSLKKFCSHLQSVLLKKNIKIHT